MVAGNQLLETLDAATTDLVFHALSDSTRRHIVARVATQDCSVSTLARSYSMSFAAVQKHVAVLERSGLVTKRRHGREQFVRANLDTIQQAALLLDQLAELWSQRIGRIDELLRTEPFEPTEPTAPWCSTPTERIER